MRVTSEGDRPTRSTIEGTSTQRERTGATVGSIETDRLLIREVRSDDLDGFLAYMRRDDYWRYLLHKRTTQHAVARHISRCLRRQAQRARRNYFLAATLKDTGEITGEGILNLKAQRSAEIGWSVSADHRGAGLATEIGRALLWLGFMNFDLHRLYAWAHVDNAASIRVMEKIGMRHEGVLREHFRVRGEWWSSSVWSMLAHEFDGAPSVRMRWA